MATVCGRTSGGCSFEVNVDLGSPTQRHPSMPGETGLELSKGRDWDP